MRYDKHDLLRDLIPIVEGKEGYAYLQPTVVSKVTGREINQCVYFNEGKPSCLWGHWMHAKGVQVPDHLNDEAIDSSEVLEYLGGELGITFTDDAARLMWRTQGKQDEGESWGDVLQWAKEYVSGESY